MAPVDDARRLYLDLLKAAVRNSIYRDEVPRPSPREREFAEALRATLREKYGARAPDWSAETLHAVLEANRPVAHTLAELAQVDNVLSCVETVLADDVPGDLIETGVFRGGQTILMRGILKAYGVTDRRVFVADSFQGLPAPKLNIDDAIAHDVLDSVAHFAISADRVRDNFRRYGLLDEQVCFLEGWFCDTLPHAPISKIAVMRLDGDYYESTRDALTSLYGKLSVGGFAIIDDYGLPLGCRQAVDEFRAEQGIREPLRAVDAQTVFWRREQ